MWNLIACAFAVFVGCLVSDPFLRSVNFGMAVFNFGLAMRTLLK